MAHAMAANEEVQRRFRYVVISRLARIEAVLSDVQGCQLVEFWPPDKVTDEKRAVYLREVEERVSRASDEMGLRMVKYVWGGEKVFAQKSKTRRERSAELSYEI